MSITLDGTNGITFPSSTVQSDAGVGYGQTWQDMTSDRSVDTTYTNNTSNPIIVSVIAGGSPAGILTLYVNGLIISRSWVQNVNDYTSVQAVVPPGQTYSVHNLNDGAPGGSNAIRYWMELRYGAGGGGGGGGGGGYTPAIGDIISSSNASNMPASGYLKCDGSTVSSTTYSSLVGKIPYNYNLTYQSMGFPSSTYISNSIWMESNGSSTVLAIDGEGDPSNVYYSTNSGTTWSKTTMTANVFGGTADAGFVVWTGTQFIAYPVAGCAVPGLTFATSTNGVTWTAVETNAGTLMATKYGGTNNTVFGINWIKKIGSKYFASFENYTTYGGVLAVSSDGLTWSFPNAMPTVSINGTPYSISIDNINSATPIIFFGSYYLSTFSAYDSSYIYNAIGVAYSTDGLNWSIAFSSIFNGTAGNYGGNGYLTQIASGKIALLFNNGIIYTSTNGTSWSSTNNIGSLPTTGLGGYTTSFGVFDIYDSSSNAYIHLNNGNTPNNPNQDSMLITIDGGYTYIPKYAMGISNFVFSNRNNFIQISAGVFLNYYGNGTLIKISKDTTSLILPFNGSTGKTSFIRYA
jgi:hypothetical protein